MLNAHSNTSPHEYATNGSREVSGRSCLKIIENMVKLHGHVYFDLISAVEFVRITSKPNFCVLFDLVDLS